jgi:phosphate acetyltransferase
MNAAPTAATPGFTDDAAESHVTHPERKHEKYERLIAQAKSIPPIPTAVAWPCEVHALEGPIEAAREKIIKPVLVGSEALIRDVAKKANLDLAGCDIVDLPTEELAAAGAVSLVREGKAHGIMKGSLHTDILMHAVVSKEGGLRTSRRISHVFLIDVPTYPEVLFVTDAAINIFPDIDCKRDIVQNAIDLHIGLGLGEPRVGILSAVEVVNPKIPGTTDAAILCKMADRGQIKGGVLDGPLALDNAINLEAAKIKGITSPVAGRAQILVVPDLEAGNMLAKNLIFLAGADAAGIVLGAAVPVILTSRADSVRTRLASTAVGSIYAHYLMQQKEKSGKAR